MICIFALLSSFKLVESFQPYQKLMRMHFMFQMCMPMCICFFFFPRFHIYWNISKCSILYIALPHLCLPPTTFNVIEIFTKWSNYCVLIPSLIFVKTFVKCLICYITFIALFQVCQQFSKMPCLLFVHLTHFLIACIILVIKFLNNLVDLLGFDVHDLNTPWVIISYINSNSVEGEAKKPCN